MEELAKRRMHLQLHLLFLLCVYLTLQQYRHDPLEAVLVQVLAIKQLAYVG